MAGFIVGKPQQTALGGLATGIGQGLQQLATQKLMELQKQREQSEFMKAMQGLTSAEGYQYSPEQAKLASLFDQKQRLGFLQGLAPGGAYTGQPQGEVLAQKVAEETPISYRAGAEQEAQLNPQQEQQAVQTQPSALQLGDEINRLNTGQPLQLSVKDVLQQAKDAGHELTPDKVRKAQEAVQRFNSSPELQQKYVEQYEQAQQAQQRQPQAEAGLPERKPLLQKPLTEYQKLQADLAKERQQTTRQAQVERINQPYNTALDKRITGADEVLDKGLEMLSLLEQGDVASGLSGLKPNIIQNTDSQTFDALGDDAAAALSSLQSGVQTISKIKFNKDRKANLRQNRETQIARIKEMNKTAEKILVEGDVRNYLNQNGQIPNVSSEVQKAYSTISQDIPDIPENAEIGKEYVDPKTKTIWRVGGKRMMFDGFADRRK